MPRPTSCWPRKRSGSARAWRRAAPGPWRASAGSRRCGPRGRQRRETLGSVRLDVASGQPSGKIVAELTDASKSYDGRPIVHNFSATLLRGDKVGLIGPNGAGKTTLLKLILGELAPDSGKVRQGANLQVAYFDQMRNALDLDATLEDFISPGSEWIEIGAKRQHVKSYLGDFLFSPARANSPVRSLSGGERNRLLLARLFARPANVLVLDEPTNDLDIDTLELLEDLLQNFEGTVFLVSHDRTFLDNVVTSTIAFEGEGRWREYEGGVQDWLTQSRRAQAIAAAAQAAPASAASSKPASRGADAPAPVAAPAQRKKLSYKEQRELEALPALVDTLEAEQAGIRTRWPMAACMPPTRPAPRPWPSAMPRSTMRCCRRWSAGNRAEVQPACSASLTQRARAASSRVRMRSAWRRNCPCSMHRASAFSSRAGVVSVASSLVSSRGSTRSGGAARKAHAPVRRQDLGKATHIDGALQAVQGRQPGGMFRGNVAVGVVLDDVEVVLVGQLQHAVGAAGRQAVAGRVVEHAHAHIQLGPVHFAVAGHDLQIGAIGAARYRQDLHAQCRQAGKLHRPAGLLHHHRIAGPQKSPAHDIQRMGGAHGGDDLLGRRLYVQAGQLLGQQRRRPLSPMGSPYCNENSCSARVLVTLRTAAGMKVDSSQSGGNTPVPGCGLALILWNMPRIKAVALTGGAPRPTPPHGQPVGGAPGACGIRICY
jgi:ABC-type Mn2+/Zn2+ transport system ATPase subunit